MENTWPNARKLDRKAASLIGLPSAKGTPRPARTNAELLADDAEYVIRPWNSIGEPVPIVEANGLHVRDADGKEYVDFTSGYFVNQAGHCHPKVLAAAVDQMYRVCQVSARQSTDASIRLAKRLAQLTPGALKKSLFTTGGCESSEFALKMARQFSGKVGVAVLENGFHGLSAGTLAACSNAAYRKTVAAPLDPNFTFLPTPYCYRCQHSADCKLECVDEIEARLDAHPEVGTIMAETVQAVGGVIPPERWWHRVDEMRRRRGLLLVLDEIQTGLGRTGALFAAEHYGLEPDVMTMAKGLSGGIGSLGAVTATPELAAHFAGGTTPTSAGNAASCAAGLALIEVILEEHLCENALAMGRYLTDAVADRNIPWVGDIRFKGLLGGVELVQSRSGKEPVPGKLMTQIKVDLLERGFIITTSGLHGNVLRLQPPLCITARDIDQFVAALDQSVRSICGQALAA